MTIVKRDRPLRALELLAAADGHVPEVTWQAKRDATVPGDLTREQGLYITTLIEQAGEQISQRTLTWFGHVLRDAETHGWVVRTGQAQGGWQKGRPIRWAITPAGRQHVLEVQARRERKAVAARAADDAIRARQAALKKARRTYDKATATRHEREQVTIMLRDAGVGWRDIGVVTGYTYQTARNDYRNGQRQWPSRISPRPPTVKFSPRSKRFAMISEVVAGETGLTEEQISGVLLVMHGLGFTIQVPTGFRFHVNPDIDVEEPVAETAAEVADTDAPQLPGQIVFDSGMDAACGC
jgi:hypothetical protein